MACCWLLGQADWLREAELKHCRVAMLATLGCIVQVHILKSALSKVPSDLDSRGGRTLTSENVCHVVMLAPLAALFYN